MAKLQRKSAKLFAEDATAAAGGLAQFGSLAAGTPNYSTDPDVIQALQAYKDGWSSAVLGTKSPALEDRNALDYLLSYQQAYIMQRGIPEWLDTETYYQGSFASKSDGSLYVSKVDNNTGNDPALDTTETYWIAFPTPADMGRYVLKTGDTMSGSLTFSATNNRNLKIEMDNANDKACILKYSIMGQWKGLVLNEDGRLHFRNYESGNMKEWPLLDSTVKEFHPVNQLIVSGGIAAAGEYSLPQGVPGSTGKFLLFSVNLGTTTTGFARLWLKTKQGDWEDDWQCECAVCGTNNGFGTSGSVVLPSGGDGKVTIRLDPSNGAPNFEVYLIGYWGAER